MKKYINITIVLPFVLLAAVSVSAQMSLKNKMKQMRGRNRLIKGAKEQKVLREDAKTITCRDFYGHEVTLSKKPQRVIVGYLSMVSVWTMAGGKVIAVPSNNRTGAEILDNRLADLPVIGSFSNLNMEKIFQLKPDLVILSAFSGRRGLKDKSELLKGAGIETLSVYYGNYAGFLELLNMFARINGNDINKIDKARKMIKRVDSLTAKASKLKSPRFASIFMSGRAFSTELNKANTAQIAMMLNGTNVVEKFGTAIGGNRIPFSMERLVMEDPDIIFVTTMGNSKKFRARMKKEIMADPVWKSLRAVKNGNVHFLPNELFLYKANEHYDDAFLYLAKLLYPKEKWSF